MKIEEVLQALREGKKVKRKGWSQEVSLESRRTSLSVSDLLADDWEVEKSKVLVADYFFPVNHSSYYGPDGKFHKMYAKYSYVVGKQPAEAVLVPGSEREETK